MNLLHIAALRLCLCACIGRTTSHFNDLVYEAIKAETIQYFIDMCNSVITGLSVFSQPLYHATFRTTDTITGEKKTEKLS